MIIFDQDCTPICSQIRRTVLLHSQLVMVSDEVLLCVICLYTFTGQHRKYLRRETYVFVMYRKNGNYEAMHG